MVGNDIYIYILYYIYYIIYIIYYIIYIYLYCTYFVQDQVTKKESQQIGEKTTGELAVTCPCHSHVVGSHPG